MKRLDIHSKTTLNKVDRPWSKELRRDSLSNSQRIAYKITMENLDYLYMDFGLTTYIRVLDEKVERIKEKIRIITLLFLL